MYTQSWNNRSVLSLLVHLPFLSSPSLLSSPEPDILLSFLSDLREAVSSSQHSPPAKFTQGR